MKNEIDKTAENLTLKFFEKQAFTIAKIQQGKRAKQPKIPKLILGSIKEPLKEYELLGLL